ncbi:MAG: putative DNA binding domain-containing protein [Chloroflexi bacterium]|nr:putative DNA binding domain-containing protein [Chloroflexota bacterium]
MTSSTVPPLLAALLERLQGQESLEVEYKSAHGGFPKSIWPTISAFANTNGGWILLGFTEQEDIPVIEGVRNASKLLTILHDSIRNPQKLSSAICGVDDILVESLDGKEIVILRVPAASRKERPVYINGNPYAGTYVRRHAGDYRCTKPEVDRMMREASDTAADSTILKHFGWEDLDRETFRRYRRRYQTQNPDSPWNSHDDERFLEAIGGYRRDRESGAKGITVAGLLLAGEPEAIRNWRTRHLIDYRLVLDNDDPDSRWEDRVVWESNLFEAFETIYPRLVAGLPTPFRLSAGVRVDQSSLHIALREALVNLLVHTDYAEMQASLIKRSPEGYLFRNPGNSRISEYDLFTSDRSDPRNPELIRMFDTSGWQRKLEPASRESFRRGVSQASSCQRSTSAPSATSSC